MAKPAEMEIDLYARDLRMIRAARDVLGRYSLIKTDESADGLVQYAVTGGKAPYSVSVHARWKQQPVCTCPDAAQRAKTQNGGYCKHIIAVLLKDPSLKYQLLELFL